MATEAATINQQMIAALRQVPEKKLRLVELVNKVVKEDGELDYELIQKMLPEVNLARAEAAAYCRATEQAIRSLSNLPGRPAGGAL